MSQSKNRRLLSLVATLGLLPAPADAAPITVTERWRLPSFGAEIGSDGMDVGDIDGDGKPEVVGVSGTELQQSFWYVLQAKNGGYVQTWRSVVGYFRSPRLVDVDGDGADEVVILSKKEIEVHTGRPPRLLISIPIRDPDNRDAIGLDAADVDGDGVVEAVATTLSGVFMYDLRFGGEELSRPDLEGDVVRIGNVDADPQLEIVVGARFATGTVIDGKTKQIEWQVNGIHELLELANLDDDPQLEILSAFPGRGLYTYNADLKSAGWTLPDAHVGRLAVAPGPSPQEVYFSDDTGYGPSNGDIEVVSGADGHFLRSLENPYRDASSLIVADLDHDSKLEALFGTAESLEPNYVFVKDAQTGDTEWQSDGWFGPSPGLDYGDLDGDGAPEFLISALQDPRGLFLVYDANTVEREAMETIDHDFHENLIWRVVHGNVDNDPQSEMFITTSDGFNARVLCLDGLTHSTEWYAAMPAGRAVTALRLANIDQDSGLELIAVSAATVFVFDASTGRREWFTPTGSAGTLLRLAQLDGDAALELAGGNASLFVIDTGTHAVQLQTPDRKITALDTPDLDGDGIAEIVVGNQTGQVQRLDVSTGEFVETLGDFPSPNFYHFIQGLVVKDVTGDGRPELIFGLDGQVRIEDFVEHKQLWNSGSPLDFGVGANDSLIVADIDQNGLLDIFVNDGITGVRAFEIAPQEVGARFDIVWIVFVLGFGGRRVSRSRRASWIAVTPAQWRGAGSVS